MDDEQARAVIPAGQCLEMAGVEFVDERVPNAPGHFAPVGVCAHHTASPPPSTAPSLRVVKFGRSDVPGPLCNVLVGRDGTAFLIADGRANDTGRGLSRVVEETRAGRAPKVTARDRGFRSADDDANLNQFFYDVEYENNGVGEPYPLVQLASGARVLAALLSANGWGVGHLTQHKCCTARKIDMSYAGDLWADVDALLGQGDDDVPLSEKDVGWIVETWHAREFGQLQEQFKLFLGEPGELAGAILRLAEAVEKLVEPKSADDA